MAPEYWKWGVVFCKPLEWTLKEAKQDEILAGSLRLGTMKGDLE